MYLLKVKDLSSKYKQIRRTRPDGNCFFRAFSYAYLEQLLTDKKEYDKFYEIAKNSKEILVALGFSQFTVEDFYDTVSLEVIVMFIHQTPLIMASVLLILDKHYIPIMYLP